jgi:hypothetical protein
LSRKPGVAFRDTLKVAWDDLPVEGKEAFKYMGEIMQYFQANNPDVRFIVHDGVDQAQCGAKCADEDVRLSDGSTVKVGIDSLRRNIAKTCRDYHLECLDLPLPPDGANPAKLLTWHQDGHYNVRGNQWVARQLSDLLAAKIQNGRSSE